MTSARLSFNEVETLSAKAARGAGLGWGQADDLGRAARWLAERGLDWATPLLALLDDARATEKVTDLAAQADRAGFSPPGDRWAVHGLPPTLLAAFLSDALHGREISLVLRSGDGEIWLGPNESGRWSELSSLAGEIPCSIDARPVQLGSLPSPILLRRPDPVLSCALRRLAAYAERLLVPASDTSRTRGAGASRLDDE